MTTHTIVWMIHIILLIILAIILLTPKEDDIKKYFDKQDKGE